MSSIFLTENQELILRQAVEDYNAIADKIAIYEFGTQEQIDKLYDSTRKAKETLATEINEPIRRFEQNNGGSKGRKRGEITQKSIEPKYHDSGMRELAREKERLRKILRLRDDGEIEFRHHAMGADGRALFYIVGKRYAYENGLVDSPAVPRKEIKPMCSDSDAATNVFLSKAEEHLTKTSNNMYHVAIDDVPQAIDWALDYLRDPEPELDEE